MKKIISILLVAVLLLSLTACGKSREQRAYERFNNYMEGLVDSWD